MTSIRLDADLLEKAAAFNINLSRLCEYTLRREVNERILDLSVVPVGVTGISRKSRVIMTNKKFKDVTKIKAGERVMSYNPTARRVEEANIIDVGPLTPEGAFVTTTIIEDNIGTRIEVLPDTKIFCWKDSFGESDWYPAKNIQAGYHVSTASPKSFAGGSTRIQKVRKNHVRDVLFKLEVYPNNSFFANSNPRRKTHYLEDYLPSVWAFPLKGYLGQIGRLLQG